MFYTLSKIGWFLAQPSSQIALILTVGFILWSRPNTARVGRVTTMLGIVILLVAGLSPLANVIILPLEDRIKRTTTNASDRVHGIIILGGFETGRISVARRSLATNAGGERLSQALLLARRYPDAKVLFSGGAAGVLRSHLSGAESVIGYLHDVGIARSRLLLEGKSRNTYENAVYSKAVAKPRNGERWLLVTSAFHMPRALGCFRRVGFPVEPWPVDFRTAGTGDRFRPFDNIGKGLRRLDIAAKEWIGLLAYYLTDRTDALFPQASN